MKALIIGGGGREHTLAWALSQSPKITQLFAAPGNPGMARLGECVHIPVSNIDGLIEFAKQEQIDWTIVGPEAPLCDGLADRFAETGLKVFGPSQGAAQLEGSKVFAKRFMKEHAIPSAAFEVFTDPEKIHAYISSRGLPQVIKADGLAAGKGVFVCHSNEDVTQAIEEIFIKKTFGDAGNEVVVEDCLLGVETSFLAFSDGNAVLPLEPAQDHKPIYDGNKGPNTGGMGTFCPTDTLSPELKEIILKEIVQKTIDGMRNRGTPFRGILYTGLMLTSDGPKVLEFNVRFGDPEAQVMLPRLKTDLIDIFEASESGNLGQVSLEWDPRHALCVVMSSQGYPGSYRKGDVITGLNEINDEDVIVFHAGTKQENDKIITTGGRVLGVTALGKDRTEACEKAYAAVKKISWEGCYYRRDIGK
jgi:phosphoribosylamine--glycine ligase